MQAEFLRYIFTGLFLFFLVNFGVAQKDTVIVEDLSDDFLVYDPLYKTFVPLDNAEVNRISLYHDFSDEAGYKLIFKAAKGLSLYVNHKLFYENLTDSSVNVAIPVEQLQSSDKGKKLISFFQASGELPEKLVVANIIEHTTLADKLLAPIKRNVPNKNAQFAFFLFIFGYVVVVKNKFPKGLLDYMGLGKAGSTDETSIYYDFFSFSSIGIIALNSFGLAFLFSFINKNEYLIDNDLLGLFTISLIIFMLFYAKYLLIHLAGSLFALKNFAKNHFKELVRLTLLFNFILVPVVAVINFSELIDFEISYMGFLLLFIFSLVLVLFKLIVLTFRVSDFKYIYLFSYLCLAEIIPLGIALKITLF